MLTLTVTSSYFSRSSDIYFCMQTFPQKLNNIFVYVSFLSLLIIETPGVYIWYLSADVLDVVTNGNLACLQWYRDQDPAVIQSDSSVLDPCPCTRSQILADYRYMMSAEGNPEGCYEPRFPVSQSVRQLCCYDR